jgi:hypothetical protein
MTAMVWRPAGEQARLFLRTWAKHFPMPPADKVFLMGPIYPAFTLEAIRLKYLRMRPSRVRSWYLRPAASSDYSRQVRRADF